VKQDAVAAASSTCFKKWRKYPNSKCHLPSLLPYISFLDPEVKTRAMKNGRNPTFLFRRLSGNSRRARCANQLGENGRKPGFIIGEFGSFREFWFPGAAGPGGIYPQVIHRLFVRGSLGV
jgi:hypothetical protein